MIEDTTYEKNVYVQHADCVVRDKCFSDVSYDVALNLPRGDWYSGCVDVSFKVTELPTTDCFLDFRGIQIAQYVINDEPVDMNAAVFRNHHVNLPSGHLRVGETNTARIFFLNKYRKDGVGLHSFIDKVDGGQYLYTQFEADFCHYVFPCFDQPDLKATWRFQCATTSDWTIMSNEAEIDAPESDSAALEAKCTKANQLFSSTSNTEPTEKKFVFF